MPAPVAGELFRNPAIATTYRRIVDESRGGSREEEIERARLAWYEGFVADEIDRFCADEGRFFTVGYSSGSWLINQLTCIRASALRGAATVSGGEA